MESSRQLHQWARRLRIAVYAVVLLMPLFLLKRLPLEGMSVCHASDEELFEVDPARVTADIEKYFVQLTQALAASDLGHSRQLLRLLDRKMECHKKDIPRKERTAYAKRMAARSKELERTEDSLVQVNLHIIETEGIDAGVAYYQTLVQSGVSEAKLLSVDKGIADFAPIAQQRHEESLRRTALARLDAGHSSREIQDPELRQVAERISRQRADSVATRDARKDSIAQTEEEKQRRVEELGRNRTIARSNAAKIEGFLTGNEIDRAYSMFQKTREHQKQFFDRSEFTVLKARVEAAYDSLATERNRALDQEKRIQALIAQRRGAGAHGLLEKHRAGLKEHLGDHGFSVLEASAIQAKQEYIENLRKAQSSAGEIDAFLEQEKADSAHDIFQRDRTALEHYLPGDLFEGLRDNVDSAYTGLLDRRKRAADYAQNIDRLIRQREGKQAYAQFRKGKTGLAKYLDSATCKALQANATSARNDFVKNKENMDKVAARTGILLARDSIEAAHTMFGENLADLKHYVTAKEYIELKAKVDTKYQDFIGCRKRATAMSRKLMGMTRRGEAIAAYREFRKESPTLKRCLDSAEYVRLGSGVSEARKEYLSNSKEAVNITRDLYALLDQHKADDAHSLFLKQERHLMRFLKVETYGAVKSRVAKAYDEFVDMRKRAKAFVRKAYGGMRKGEVVAVNRAFWKERARLKEYLDAETFDKLEKDVKSAYAARNKSTGKK